MTDQRRDQSSPHESAAPTIEQVLAQLFETIAMTQAQNDVLLGLVTKLVGQVEDIDEEELLDRTQRDFLAHYERRIDQMKSEYAFFGGSDEADSPPSE